MSREQEEMIKALRAQGYRAEVCRGWDEARETIQRYLEDENEKAD